MHKLGYLTTAYYCLYPPSIDTTAIYDSPVHNVQLSAKDMYAIYCCETKY